MNTIIYLFLMYVKAWIYLFNLIYTLWGNFNEAKAYITIMYSETSPHSAAVM